jgi:hypothetical protein
MISGKYLIAPRKPRLLGILLNAEGNSILLPSG